MSFDLSLTVSSMFTRSSGALLCRAGAVRPAALIVLLPALACSGLTSDPVSAGREPEFMTISLSRSSIEPAFDSIPLAVKFRDRKGTIFTIDDRLVSWSSSNSDVAAICGANVCGRRAGTAQLLATYRHLSATARLDVAWGPGAQINLSPIPSEVEEGATVMVDATVRGHRPLFDLRWSTTDPAILFAGGGVLTGIAPGEATVFVSFRGLEVSFPVRVRAAIERGTSGFGYAYTENAPYVDDYDVATEWSPEPSYAFSSTGVTPLLQLSPPYPTRADFGWMRANFARDSLILHAVALADARCQALMYRGFYSGPSFWCGDASNRRLELVAATVDQFTGTFAVVRPGLPSVTERGTSIQGKVVGVGAMAYQVPGLSRSEMYWFTTSAEWGISSCTIAPGRATAPDASAVVTCADRFGAPVMLPHNAIGFAADAMRGDEPRVFAELDTAGTVLRRSEAGLEISSVRRVAGVRTIRLTGPRIATYTRLPAILLSAVSPTGIGRCWIAAPRRVAGDLEVDVSCGDAEGVMLGVTY